MTEGMTADQTMEPDWRTRLRAHPLHERVFIACVLIAAIFALVFFQVGLLIIGFAMLSGTIVVAVLKAGFGRKEGPKSSIHE